MMTDQTDQTPKPPKPLSPKRRRFVEAYLATWNASEAARQAGYAKADRQGPRLLRFVEVQAAISQRLKESAMQADEVLNRLADQAKVNIADFVTESEFTPVDKDGNPLEPMQMIQLDWDAIRKYGHLIKSIKMTANGPAIELHDGQKALELIGRHLALFTDNIAMPGAKIKAYMNISPDDWDEKPSDGDG